MFNHNFADMFKVHNKEKRNKMFKKKISNIRPSGINTNLKMENTKLSGMVYCKMRKKSKMF